MRRHALRPGNLFAHQRAKKMKCAALKKKLEISRMQKATQVARGRVGDKENWKMKRHLQKKRTKQHSYAGNMARDGLEHHSLKSEYIRCRGVGVSQCMYSRSYEV